MKNQNDALLNIISPTQLEFNMNDIHLGENICKIFILAKYPTNLSVGWLGKINNIKGTNVISMFVPKMQGELISAISKNISNDRAKSISSNDANIRLISERKAEDGERILKQINENNESVGKFVNIIMVSANDSEALKKACDKVQNTVMGLGISVRTLPALQENLFKGISPYDILPNKIEELGGRVGLLSTFMGGFFNSNDSFNDNNGYYFAKDLSGGLMILDIWKRGGDRTNSNMTILGKSGSGKSTAIKKMMLNEIMLGTKIIVVDPEREYDEITKNLGGDVINLGGGSSILNPLEINKIDLTEENTENMGALGLHLQSLEVFFSLYLESITDRQKSILNKALIELYNNFNIDWDTDITNFKNEEYPIMTDLYNLLKDKIKKDKDYEELILLIENCTNGTDKFLFNGHTKIKSDSQLICLDTHDLNNSSDRVKKTQYFNIISWIWKQISKNRKEKIIVVLDEIYLLIDIKIPQTLIGVKNIAKRIRKYEGSLILSTQSLVDLLAPEIKQHGQALLTQSCYKIFLGADGKDLQEIVETFDLKDKHKDIILGGVQGRGLMIAGSKHYIFNMELTDHEIKYIGGKGGR